MFDYLPPLLFIYAVPMVRANVPLSPVAFEGASKVAGQGSGAGEAPGDLSTGETEPHSSLMPIIPSKSPVYGWMSSTVLPFFLLLMLTNVDLVSTFRVLGRGILVMLMGTAGVVIGAPLAFALVKSRLSGEAWTAFGALAGSWSGGAGNMAAMERVWDVPASSMGLAVLGDTLIYLVWIPILLTSKSCAGWFSRFARVDPRQNALLEDASADAAREQQELKPRHVLYWLFIGLAGTWVATLAAEHMPEGEVLTAGTWTILFITVIGIGLSFTPVRHVPGTHEVATAFVFLFMANVGAKADLAGLAGDAPWFIMAALLWIFVHGAFCVLGARILHVDIHTTAIASAANIGGVATASIVAEHHNDRLVPAAVLMAMFGYAVGNFAAYLAGTLCKLIS
jgi:uncharacterized membrane protein